MSINWGLAQGSNSFQNAFGTGLQVGQTIKRNEEEKQVKNALAAYDPANPETLKPIMQADPRLGLQLRGQQAQQAEAQADARRADLPLITRLVETSTDEASYQRNRATAQQYGVDTSTLPQQFDPAWRDQQLMSLKALQDPSKAEALSTAGKQAIDMGYRPGTPEFNKAVQEIWTAGESKPYVVGGETRLYQPRIGGQGGAVDIPKLSDPSQISQLKPGDQFYDPNGVLRMVPQGGPTPPASGTFPGQ